MNPAAGTLLAVLLSLVSAAGYALAAVAQSRLAAASPPLPTGAGRCARSSPAASGGGRSA